MKNKIMILVISICFLISDGIIAQQTNQDTSSQAIAMYSALEFDNWINNQFVLREKLFKPTKIEKIIFTRIENDKFTTDDAILLCLEFWKKYDHEMILKPEITINDIDQFGSIKYIDSVSSKLYKRPLLIAIVR